MIIKDLQTGKIHEYRTNQHDSLVISEDGRTLSYYNLQNGDGSRYGPYRFGSTFGGEYDNYDEYWNIGSKFYSEGDVRNAFNDGYMSGLDFSKIMHWRGNYSPYRCGWCGKYSDSKTPFCCYCGRKAVNYESK